MLAGMAAETRTAGGKDERGSLARISEHSDTHVAHFTGGGIDDFTMVPGRELARVFLHRVASDVSDRSG